VEELLAEFGRLMMAGKEEKPLRKNGYSRDNEEHEDGISTKSAR
jgi:hypothetical protein